MFETQVTYEWEPHRQLSRLRPAVDVAAGLNQNGHDVWLKWRSLAFTFGDNWHGSRPGNVFLNLKCFAPTFGETSMGDLIDLLFERGVLKYRDY